MTRYATFPDLEGHSVFITGGGSGTRSRNGDKNGMILEAARILNDLGFGLVATSGTARFLPAAGIPATHVNKVSAAPT